MNNSKDRILQAKRMLRDAFQYYEKEPETSVVATVDQVFLAAVLCAKIEINPISSDKLLIKFQNDDELQVELPYKSLASFRAILARIGTICLHVSKQRYFKEGMRQLFFRFGVIPSNNFDGNLGINRYVSFDLTDKPVQTLYSVEGNLEIMAGKDKIRSILHVVMQNDTDVQFLNITDLNSTHQPR